MLLRNLFNVADYVGTATRRYKSQVRLLSKLVLRLFMLLLFLLSFLHALLVELQRRCVDVSLDTLAALRHRLGRFLQQVQRCALIL